MSQQAYLKKTRAAQDITARQEGMPQIHPGMSNSSLAEMLGGSEFKPISPALRAKFEPGFSADFSNVRVSRGEIPAEFGIEAVTRGTDVLIDKNASDDTMGHELAHVVQQASGVIPKNTSGVLENAALERAADTQGARAAVGMRADTNVGAPLAIPAMNAAAAPAMFKKTPAEKAAEKQKKAQEKAAKKAAAQQQKAEKKQHKQELKQAKKDREAARSQEIAGHRQPYGEEGNARHSVWGSIKSAASRVKHTLWDRPIEKMHDAIDDRINNDAAYQELSGWEKTKYNLSHPLAMMNYNFRTESGQQSLRMDTLGRNIQKDNTRLEAQAVEAENGRSSYSGKNAFGLKAVDTTERDMAEAERKERIKREYLRDRQLEQHTAQGEKDKAAVRPRFAHLEDAENARMKAVREQYRAEHQAAPGTPEYLKQQETIRMEGIREQFQKDQDAKRAQGLPTVVPNVTEQIDEPQYQAAPGTPEYLQEKEAVRMKAIQEQFRKDQTDRIIAGRPTAGENSFKRLEARDDRRMAAIKEQYRRDQAERKRKTGFAIGEMPEKGEGLFRRAMGHISPVNDAYSNASDLDEAITNTGKAFGKTVDTGPLGTMVGNDTVSAVSSGLSATQSAMDAHDAFKAADEAKRQGDSSEKHSQRLEGIQASVEALGSGSEVMETLAPALGWAKGGSFAKKMTPGLSLIAGVAQTGKGIYQTATSSVRGSRLDNLMNEADVSRAHGVPQSEQQELVRKSAMQARETVRAEKASGGTEIAAGVLNSASGAMDTTGVGELFSWAPKLLADGISALGGIGSHRYEKNADHMVANQELGLADTVNERLRSKYTAEQWKSMTGIERQNARHHEEHVMLQYHNQNTSLQNFAAQETGNRAEQLAENAGQGDESSLGLMKAFNLKEQKGGGYSAEAISRKMRHEQSGDDTRTPLQQRRDKQRAKRKAKELKQEEKARKKEAKATAKKLKQQEKARKKEEKAKAKKK